MENSKDILSLVREVRTRMEQLSDSDKIIAQEALFALLNEFQPEHEIHYMSWK